MDLLAQLGPAATGLAAVVALVIGLATVRQRAAADRRDQWWKRAQWALDRTLDEDADRRAIGFAALRVLATSELAGRDEGRLLEVAWQHELAGGAASARAGDDGDLREGEDDGTTTARRQ